MRSVWYRSAHRAQPRAVEVGEVHEGRPVQWARTRQVDVIADQDRCPGRPCWIETAATVRQDHRLTSREVRGANSMRDGIHAAFLV